ncbi:MAG TPA: hypothetical protein VLR90_12000 [Blastocatellia bacterium]|nr:hypothetical protein [Blastocatellia bacterium]
MPRSLGQMGGTVISGWNARNRVVVGRDVKPGQQIQLAVFDINGPLSNRPTNFIWMRYARLDFYKTEMRGPIAITPRHAHNFAWGDPDGKTLYLCARSGLYRMRLGIACIRPANNSSQTAKK